MAEVKRTAENEVVIKASHGEAGFIVLALRMLNWHGREMDEMYEHLFKPLVDAVSNPPAKEGK